MRQGLGPREPGLPPHHQLKDRERFPLSYSLISKQPCWVRHPQYKVPIGPAPRVSRSAGLVVFGRREPQCEWA